MDEFKNTIFNAKDGLTILFGIVLSLVLAFYKLFFDLGKRRLAMLRQGANSSEKRVQYSQLENTGFTVLVFAALCCSVMALFILKASGIPDSSLFVPVVLSIAVFNLVYILHLNPFYPVRLLSNPHVMLAVNILHSVAVVLVCLTLIRQMFYQYVLVNKFPVSQTTGFSLTDIILLCVFLILNVLVLADQRFRNARYSGLRQFAAMLLVIFVGICLYVPVTRPFKKGYVLKYMEQSEKQVKLYLDSMEKMSMGY